MPTTTSSQVGLKEAGKGLHHTIKDDKGNDVPSPKYEAFHDKKDDMVVAYQEYDDHTVPCKLQELTAMALTKSQKGGLKELYDRSRPFLKELWSEVASDNGEYIMCPLCGQKVVEDLDHYIPRAKMPEYSVHLKNLIPTCHECNDDKGDLWLNDKGERMIINAYFDKIGDMSRLLKSTIEIDADTGVPRVTVTFDDVEVAAVGEQGRLVTSTYENIESVRKQWKMAATSALKRQVRQIKSSITVRKRLGQYTDGDWDFEKETLIETITDMKDYEFIEKVVYDSMLDSADFDAWLVNEARKI